jgi:hypothetical protein
MQTCKKGKGGKMKEEKIDMIKLTEELLGHPTAEDIEATNNNIKKRRGDRDAKLVEWLEENFSLHDVDMIFNTLDEFRDFDTKQGEITFLDFINKNY